MTGGNIEGEERNSDFNIRGFVIGNKGGIGRTDVVAEEIVVVLAELNKHSLDGVGLHKV